MRIAATPLASICDHPFAPEKISDAARRRPGRIGSTHLEPLQQLPRPPGRVALARREKDLSHALGHSVPAAQRSSAAILEAARAFGLEAIEPFVSGLPADAVALAELLHLVHAGAAVLHEANAFLHGRRHSPRHGSPRRSHHARAACHPCSRSVMSLM